MALQLNINTRTAEGKIIIIDEEVQQLEDFNSNK